MDLVTWEVKCARENVLLHVKGFLVLDQYLPAFDSTIDALIKLVWVRHIPKASFSLVALCCDMYTRFALILYNLSSQIYNV